MSGIIGSALSANFSGSISIGGVTIADGADTTEGAIADSAVTGDNSGTVNAHLRGLDKINADVWDSTNHWLKVSAQASSAVIGHVIADSGSTTAVTQATGTNLHAVIDSGTITTVSTVTAVTSITNPVTTTYGKTIKSASGTFTADGDLIALVSAKRIKVIGYAFFTAGTNVNVLNLASNTAEGTVLWTVVLQAITGSVMGANMAVPAPSFIFATAAGEALSVDVSQSDTVYWSISYFDDDAT